MNRQLIQLYYSNQNNTAIIYTAAHNHPKIIEILMNDLRVDPSARSNVACKYVAANGYLDSLKFRIKDKRVNPTDDNNTPLSAAHN